MPAAETTQIPLGFEAPDFTLPDVRSGQNVGLKELRGDKATVVMFICNHCPYVKHVLPALVEFGRDYLGKGVQCIAISSNDVVHYPEDAPDKMRGLAQSMDFPFPYLFDETQEVARAYQAVCTPDFSIFDHELRCVYRGRMDGSRPGNDVVSDAADLRHAVDCMLAGKPVSDAQVPSLGCSIKWKQVRV
ncbi:MAG: thioredoxin family protein [Flavobacteriales bacterium]|nr:thioredoxin family protein [Flavobacteriales bacterium]MCB9447500.1 thioredoxin family protein [Flavobacteriales bacterium]